MADITIDQVVAKDLHLEDLTTIDLQGSGVWDKMLRNMRVQLNDQFEKNRITGPTYGQVYAATYESTLQAAITLLLAKERQALEIKQLELQNQLTQAQIDQIHDQMQKTPYEIEQIKAQTENIKTETAQTQYNIDHILPLQATGLELENQTREYNLNTVLPTQVAQTEAQTSLTKTQEDQIRAEMQKVPYEIEVLQSQVEESKIKVLQEQYNLDNLMPAQLGQINAQTAGVVKETELKDYQLVNLYPAQLAGTLAQTENVQQDTALKEYQVQFLYPAQLAQANKQLELTEAQIAVQNKQLDLLQEQVNQAKAQTDYYAQKVVTEKAQTDATVIGDGSVIDVQVDLMNAQKDGYKRNAEQQAAQIMSNTWNVRRQTDEDTSANTTNLLDDATVGKTIQTLLSGVGVTVTPS
ncbi:hypothetical protein WID10_28095 [Klebsiella variicola]|uniref:hypothetical protein n=1 Tax=Klebsiella variicola TaxID=244366 RepID=UPI00339C3C00